MKQGRTAVWPAITVTLADAASNVGSRPNTTSAHTQTDGRRKVGAIRAC